MIIRGEQREPHEAKPRLESRHLMWFSTRYVLRWGMYAVVIGGIVGAASFAFEWLLLALQDQTREWWLYGLPILGGLLMSGIMRIDRCAAHGGTQVYIDAVMASTRPLRLLLYPLKFIASILTLGTGGSGGRLGPAVLMGGVIGSQAARLSGKNADLDRPNAAMCGAAAAIGALLQAPLGGGVFAAEVLYPSAIRYHGLFAAMLSSTAGYLVRLRLPPVAGIRAPSYILSMWDIPDILVAVVLAGLAGMAFVRIYRATEHYSRRLGPLTDLAPAVGASVAVALAWIAWGLGAPNGPEVMGTGEWLLNDTINCSFPLAAAIVVLVFKMLTTAATVGTGGSGGLFFPSLLLGAMVGNIVSQLAGAAGTETAAATGLHFGLVAAGMAASLAATINVPVAAAVMLLERFGPSYGVPIILGASLGFMVGRPQVIYRYARLEGQPESEG